MPVTLKIQPIDARGRPLPVPNRLVLERAGRVEQTVDCPPNTVEAAFPQLLMHQVYVATARPVSFKVTAQFYQVEASDDTGTLLCLLHPKQAAPALPEFEQLDPSLQAVLERSPDLDHHDEQDERALTLGVPARRLDSRTVGLDRTTSDRALRDFRAGSARWDALEDEEKAASLNLFAKMRSMTTRTGEPIWSSVRAFHEIAPDRVHVYVHPSLRKTLADTRCFGKAGGGLHRPPKDYQSDVSFKSDERYGNLQLTFFTRTRDGVPDLMDADVDDAAGIEHGEQVIRNEAAKLMKKLLGRLLKNLPEGITNPYDIHQILIHHQRGGSACGNIAPYVACYVLRLRGSLSYEL